MKDHQKLHDCTCFNLRRAARSVTQYFDEALRPSGLRATQLSLLAVVVRFGPIPITALAGKLAMDRTTLTRNLRVLEEEGYIAVNPGKDARARLVSATGSGRRALKRAIPLWKKAQAHMVKGLGDRRFKSLLGDLADTVTLSRAG